MLARKLGLLLQVVKSSTIMKQVRKALFLVLVLKVGSESTRANFLKLDRRDVRIRANDL